MLQSHVPVSMSVSPAFVGRSLSQTLVDQLIVNTELLEQNFAQTSALLRQLLARVEQDSRNLKDLQQQLQSLLDTIPPATPIPQASPAAQLSLYCFGPFKVSVDGEAVSLRRAGKGLTIIKYLASVGRRPVPRDVLLEILWPSADPQTANNRLKATMHQLRQAFTPFEAAAISRDWLYYDEGCYLLNPDLNVWTDVQAFEQLWREGMRLERAHEVDRAIVLYQKAETLYRGDFLEEDLLEEWTLARREALKDTYLTILDKLGNYWFQVGNLESAIEGWKKIILRDPWREDVYRHLMSCYFRTGQRTLALRWFEICEQTLRAQLNLAPEPETLELYQSIRAG